jgi:hypothetical protein
MNYKRQDSYKDIQYTNDVWYLYELLIEQKRRKPTETIEQVNKVFDRICDYTASLQETRNSYGYVIRQQREQIKKYRDIIDNLENIK